MKNAHVVIEDSRVLIDIIDGNKVSFYEILNDETELPLRNISDILSGGCVAGITLDTADIDVELIPVSKVPFWKRAEQVKLQEKKNRNSRIKMIYGEPVSINDKNFVRLYKVMDNAWVSSVIRLMRSLEDVLIKGIWLSPPVYKKIIRKRESVRDIIKTLSKNKPHRLDIIIARTESNRFRQVYVFNNEIVLARMADIYKDDSEEDIWYESISECSLSIKYILSNIVEREVDNVFVHMSDVEESLVRAEKVFNEGIDGNKSGKDLITEVCMSMSDATKPVTVGSSLFEIDRVMPLETGKNCRYYAHHLLSYYYWKGRIGASHFKDKETGKTNALIWGARMSTGIAVGVISVIPIYAAWNWADIQAKQDVDNYIIKEVKTLDVMRSTLASKIKTPFDTRDLKSIVEISQKWRKEYDPLEMKRVVSKVAEFADAHKDLVLMDLDISRKSSPKEIVSGEFDVVATFSMKNTDWLYKKNMNKITGFLNDLSKIEGVDNIKFTESPLALSPWSIQNLDEGMLKPKSLPFTISFNVNLKEGNTSEVKPQKGEDEKKGRKGQAQRGQK